MRAGILKPEEHFIRDEPYYEPVENEIEIFDAAYRNQLLMLLKDPTGCGTRQSRSVRFNQYMARSPCITRKLTA